MSGVKRLDHVADRIVAGLDAETLDRLRHTRRFVPQRLQQAQHAIGSRRRAQQHRANKPVTQFLRQIIEDLVAWRLNVLEQLLHQLVVVISESFHHREARGLLAIEHIALQRNDLGGGVLLVDIGALEREVERSR